MSSYRIDLGDSNKDGIVLVTLFGRAQADSIVKLLDELNVLAGRDPALRVLIDETELARASSGRAISAGSPGRGKVPPRFASHVSRRSRPIP